MIEFANDLADRIKETIMPILTSQYPTIDYSENYRVIIVRNGDRNLIEKSKKDIVSLVRKESADNLSNEEKEEIMSNHYAYRENFFIADIRGASAFAHNLEIFPVLREQWSSSSFKSWNRRFTTLLDEMLEKSYDILARAKSKANRELGGRIDEIHLMRLELLEVISAIKGIRRTTKTRIFYSLCEILGEVFEVHELADSVTRKLDKLGEIYTMVNDSLQNTMFIRMDRTMVMLRQLLSF